MTDRNITPNEHQVSLEERWRMNGHRSGILWLTGLSASGKSTLAFALERQLNARGWNAFVLDGDNVRHGLCKDLGFSAHDRSENIRRVGEVSKLFAESGCLVITAFISPYRADRERVRTIAGNLFHEAYVDTPLAICEARDPKGLYRKARRGELLDFTGISAPYEPPQNPNIVVDTVTNTIDQSIQCLNTYCLTSFGLNIDSVSSLEHCASTSP